MIYMNVKCILSIKYPAEGILSELADADNEINDYVVKIETLYLDDVPFGNMRIRTGSSGENA